MSSGNGRTPSHEAQRDDMDTETNSPERISRRDALRRGAVLGGTLVWAAPAVQSVGMRGAFAQQNGTPETSDFCPAGEGSITRLILRYTAKGCDNLVPPTAEGSQGGCEGQDGDLPETAYVEVHVGNCGGSGPSGQPTWSGTATAFETEIDSGIPQSPQACTRMRVWTEVGGELLVDEVIHTSCSAELNLGEQYGPIEIYDGDWVA